MKMIDRKMILEGNEEKNTKQTEDIKTETAILLLVVFMKCVCTSIYRNN